MSSMCCCSAGVSGCGAWADSVTPAPNTVERSSSFPAKRDFGLTCRAKSWKRAPRPIQRFSPVLGYARPTSCHAGGTKGEGKGVFWKKTSLNVCLLRLKACGLAASGQRRSRYGRPAGVGSPGGLTYDQLGFYLDNALGMFAADFLQQHRGRGCAHLHQGLTDRGEAGDEVRGDGEIVETDDGDIPGHFQPAIMESSNGADGRDVVEADNRGEVAVAHHHLLYAGVTQFGRVQEFFEPNDVAFRHRQLQQLGHAHQGAPPAGGV